MLTKEQIKDRIRAGDKVIAGPDAAVTTVKVAYQELYEEGVRRRDLLTDVLEGIVHFSSDRVARAVVAETLVKVGAWSSEALEGDKPLPLHRPHRGSDVEAFIKRARDAVDDDLRGYDPLNSAHDFAHGRITAKRQGLDRLLDDYRLHADCGVPLDEPTPTEGYAAPGEA